MRKPGKSIVVVAILTVALLVSMVGLAGAQDNETLGDIPAPGEEAMEYNAAQDDNIAPGEEGLEYDIPESAPMVGATGTQRWYLSNTTFGEDLINRTMYKGSQAGDPTVVTIAAATSVIWIANEAATTTVTFPVGDWPGGLSLVQTGNKVFTGEIGEWDGTSFTSAVSSPPTFSINGAGTFTITTDSDFTVNKDKWLAFKLTSNAGQSLDIMTDGGPSYVSSPISDPGYPVPELPSVILFSAGLITFFSYVLLIKRRGEKRRENRGK